MSSRLCRPPVWHHSLIQLSGAPSPVKGARIRFSPASSTVKKMKFSDQPGLSSEATNAPCRRVRTPPPPFPPPQPSPSSEPHHRRVASSSWWSESGVPATCLSVMGRCAIWRRRVDRVAASRRLDCYDNFRIFVVLCKVLLAVLAEPCTNHCLSSSTNGSFSVQSRFGTEDGGHCWISWRRHSKVWCFLASVVHRVVETSARESSSSMATGLRREHIFLVSRSVVFGSSLCAP